MRLSRRLQSELEETSVGEKASAAPSASRLKLSLGIPWENAMDEFIQRITSYNIFNNLLPGTLFVLFTEIVTNYKVTQDDLLISLFFYYFVGMVVSRIGSLLIEPLLRFTKFLKFANYGDFLLASKEDPKMEVLSETNNVYRAMSSLFFLLLLVKGYEMLTKKFQISGEVSLMTLVFILLLLFLFSYRKQTRYLVKRITESKQ